MNAWEQAANKFIARWQSRPDVLAALVCGSYVTGDPSPRSDIDIHIILKDDVDWRERGNEVVDGFLIEYFANPPKQIRRYFEEDYEDHSTMSMVQFLTGRVWFDKVGITDTLKAEAGIWKDRRYKSIDPVLKELKKYHLWDALDNLRDCFEKGTPDFDFVYNNLLFQAFDSYCELLGVEKIPAYQLYGCFTQPSYLTKYLKNPFPDEMFARLMISGMECKERHDRMRIFEELIIHALNQTGGFRIDGWKLRSDCTL